MTIYDACNEIKDISFVDDTIKTGHTLKDRRQANAILTILEAAQKHEIVSIEVYNQVRWERDVAISQLEEIGASFGEKMDRWKESKDEHS